MARQLVPCHLRRNRRLRRLQYLAGRRRLAHRLQADRPSRATWAFDALLAEFDSDETTENFTSNFWNNEVDLQMLVQQESGPNHRIDGARHRARPPGGHGELHPTYVLQFRAKWQRATSSIAGRSSSATGATKATVVVASTTLTCNGSPCGSPHHRARRRATSVKIQDAPNLDAGSENGSDWSGFGVSGLSPIQHDANGTFVEMIFSIGPPEDHTFIDGSVDITWMCGNSACPQPPPRLPHRRSLRRQQLNTRTTIYCRVPTCSPRRSSTNSRSSFRRAVRLAKRALATNSNYSLYPIHAAGIQGGPGCGDRSHGARPGQATTHGGDPKEHLQDASERLEATGHLQLSPLAIAQSLP